MNRHRPYRRSGTPRIGAWSWASHRSTTDAGRCRWSLMPVRITTIGAGHEHPWWPCVWQRRADAGGWHVMWSRPGCCSSGPGTGVRALRGGCRHGGAVQNVYDAHDGMFHGKASPRRPWYNEASLRHPPAPGRRSRAGCRIRSAGPRSGWPGSPPRRFRTQITTERLSTSRSIARRSGTSRFGLRREIAEPPLSPPSPVSRRRRSAFVQFPSVALVDPRLRAPARSASRSPYWAAAQIRRSASRSSG